MKWSRLFCVVGLCVAALPPMRICAQSGSGSIVLHGGVSKTVALSLGPKAARSSANLSAFDSGGVLRLVVSGSGFERNLRVPILIRSNTSYNIVASIQSQTAVATQLRVLSVESGGKLVAGDAITGVVIGPQFDMPRDDPSAREENLSTIHTSLPFTIFRGPRISLGGGLDSPDNALKIILLLSIRPKVDKGSWTMNVNLQGNSTNVMEPSPKLGFRFPGEAIRCPGNTSALWSQLRFTPTPEEESC